MSSRPEEEAVAAGNEIETGDDDRNSAASSGNRWAQGERESLMVVATFVAAAAFQAGINPPGGVWQDDGDPRYEAGKSIMAAKNESLYVTFIVGATLCLAAALTQLLMLLNDFTKKAQLSASRSSLSSGLIFLSVFSYS
ncbi:uncharacterized protein LOC111005012 [Momordica charantia]|uniref:Uncharacterized protein LOC111005012 n=1 Tax=Momordica charantia TaxID=3673 RepID=A0A6J1BR52_MOMCH|nr:uncharacterized protein LOC111005012 [Momordica charantia]